MKTAMQELIEWYKKEHFVKTPFNIQILNKFESLLEKEKEQIKEANINGQADHHFSFESRMTEAEHYYNQTYNK